LLSEQVYSSEPRLTSCKSELTLLRPKDIGQQRRMGWSHLRSELIHRTWGRLDWLFLH